MSVHIEINGVNRDSQLEASNCRINLRQFQIPTASLLLSSRDGTYRPAIGHSVVIWENASKIFSGSIWDCNERNIVRGPNEPGIFLDVTCQGLAARLSQRFCDVPHVFPAGTTAQAVILYAMAQFGAGEGITYAASGSGGYVSPGATLTAIYVLDHQSLKAVCDDMAALDGSIWFVDPDANLHFQDRDAQSAPFTFTTTSLNYNEIASKKTREEYLNEKWLAISWTAFATTEQTFTGNGSNRIFTLDHPAGEIVSVKRGEVDVQFGSEDTAPYKCGYGLAAVTQADTETVLSSEETLTVVYYELGCNYLWSESADEKTARATVEGNSGRYGSVAEDPQQTSWLAGKAALDAEVANAAHIPVVVSIVADGWGVEPIYPRPGMVTTISTDTPAISGSFLIQEVTAQLMGAVGFRYTITALDGTRIGNWIDYFAALAGQKVVPYSGAGASGGSTPVPAAPAPDILAITATRHYVTVGGIQYWYADGQITLDTANVNYAHDKKIRVVVDPAYHLGDLAIIDAPFAPDGTGKISYQTVAAPRDTIERTYVLGVKIENEDGAVTVSAQTASVTIEAGEPPVPTNLGPGLYVDSGRLKVGLQNPGKLIVNPSFQDGLNGWTVATGTAVLDATVSVSSRGHSCKFTASDTRVKATPVPVNPGDQIVAKVRVKASGLNAGTIWLYINYLDSDLAATIAPAYASISQAAATSWTTITLSFTVPADCAYAELMVYLPTLGADSWYLGSASLTPQTSTGAGTVPDGNGGLAVNPGDGTGIDGSNKVTVQTGHGMLIDPTTRRVGARPGAGVAIELVADGLTLNLGTGPILDGSSRLTLNLGPGIEMPTGAVRVKQGAGVSTTSGSVDVVGGDGITVGLTVTLNAGDGITAVGGPARVKAATGSPVTVGAGGVALTAGAGVKVSNGSVVIDLGAGAGGLQLVGGTALAVNPDNATLSVGITVSIKAGGVGPTQISSVNAAQLNVGTINVGSGGMTFSGSGGIIIMAGGSVTVSPGSVAGTGIYCYYGGTFKQAGSDVIDLYGKFVGSAVLVPGGCGASGFNPSGYTGATASIAIKDGNGNYCSIEVNGVNYGAVRLHQVGGAFVGII